MNVFSLDVVGADGAGPRFDPADRAAVASALTRLAIARPRIHALVPSVSQPLVANVAAALGIDISMTDDPQEVRPMARSASAVAVNLGMLNERRRAAAAAVASIAGGRFVLDPVKVDRVPARLDFARELLAHGPLVVKGNAAEMAALGPLPAGTVSVTTGRIDRLALHDARGERRLDLANGTAKLDRVIATGCAAGMLIAAFAAIEEDPFVAAIAALSLWNVSAEEAAAGTVGPGSFAMKLIDAVAAAEPHETAARIRLGDPPIDTRLYLILGPDAPEPVRLAREAAAGGVTLVQYRDKSGSSASQVEAVRALVTALGVPVIVNDRADVARAAGAAGVHVGHGDLAPAEARAIVGPSAIVGVTVHSLEEAAALDGVDADYVSVGGVFETSSKDNPDPPIGIEGFRAIAERLRRARPDRPIIAIAGIDAERAEALAREGADGVAVVSAITQSEAPRSAAETLIEGFKRGRP